MSHWRISESDWTALGSKYLFAKSSLLLLLRGSTILRGEGVKLTLKRKIFILEVVVLLSELGDDPLLLGKLFNEFTKTLCPVHFFNDKIYSIHLLGLKVVVVTGVHVEIQQTLMSITYNALDAQILLKLFLINLVELFRLRFYFYNNPIQLCSIS